MACLKSLSEGLYSAPLGHRSSALPILLRMIPMRSLYHFSASALGSNRCGNNAKSDTGQGDRGADAARRSRRQHLFELPGSEPRVLAADGAAARQPHRRGTAHWLSPAFGAGLSLAVDLDKVEALSPDRAALWDRVTKAPFLTVNEKRAAVGYGALAGGDRLESPTALLT